MGTLRSPVILPPLTQLNSSSMRMIADRWRLNLDDLKGQYCNRNCICCSTSSLARRFYCEKNLRNLYPIFPLVTGIYDCGNLYRLARWPHAMSVILQCNDYSFGEQHSVNIACMDGTVSPLRNCFLSVIGSHRQYGRLSLVTAGLLVYNLQRCWCWHTANHAKQWHYRLSHKHNLFWFVTRRAVQHCLGQCLCFSVYLLPVSSLNAVWSC